MSETSIQKLHELIQSIKQMRLAVCVSELAISQESAPEACEHYRENRAITELAEHMVKTGCVTRERMSSVAPDGVTVDVYSAYCLTRQDIFDIAMNAYVLGMSHRDGALEVGGGNC